MTVSPQHRILVNSRIAQRMFGEDGALIAAKKLTWLDGVDEVCPDEGIEYYHILCDAHLNHRSQCYGQRNNAGRTADNANVE
jgi:hypothetical protein